MKKQLWYASLVLAAAVTCGPGATTAMSADWFDFEMDTSLDTAGRFMDVAIEPVTGAPFVSFYEVSGGDLWMAFFVGTGGNCGNTRWSCHLVDHVGDVGPYNSIAVRQKW